MLLTQKIENIMKIKPQNRKTAEMETTRMERVKIKA